MAADKSALYGDLAEQLAALIAGETDLIANTANMAALIYHGLPDLNWAGFYFARPRVTAPPSPASLPSCPPPPAGKDQPQGVAGSHRDPAIAAVPSPAGEGGLRPGSDTGPDERELVLGPFQGKPACIRIPWGGGVCGAAAARGVSVVVPDVHEFPGHIACDPVSRSELVVVLVAAGRVVAVLDLDSPVLARFDDADRAGCERLAAILLRQHPDWR